MMLPRLEISKILVKIYEALESESIINVRYQERIICIDCKKKLIYTSVNPEFMLATLFHLSQLDDLTWEFDTTTLYDQLVGKQVSCNSTIVYLNSRYEKVDDRVRHYVDFIVNK